MMRKSNFKLSKIAVDLTPIRPFGENGGAKIFVIQLLHRLALLSPDTSFLLLINSNCYNELSAEFGEPNFKLIVANEINRVDSVRTKIYMRMKHAIRHIPHRLQNVSMFLLAKFYRKGWGGELSGILKKELGVELLFCPFTAPTFSSKDFPTVCTIYDLQYKSYPHFFTEKDVLHRDMVFRDACAKATLLTTISNYSRNTVIANSDVNPNDIRTIYLRMADRFVKGTSQNTTSLRRFNLISKRYLIYTANFWKHKNHEILMTAFSIACKNGLPSDLKLVCTGSGLDRADILKSIADRLNISDKIVFTGYTANEELEELLSNSIGMVFPSLYEGFGLPIVEAMLLKVPVACSNCTSLPEVANGAAILFDPKNPHDVSNAILRLVNDEKLRTDLVHAGYERARFFGSSDTMSKEYLDLFEDAYSRFIH